MADEESRSEDEEKKEFVFCCCFTSQAGVVICSVQGLTLLITTITCNMFMENEEKDSGATIGQYFILFAFLAIMVSSYLCAFWSAYAYKVVFADAAKWLMLIGIVVYLVLSLLSFLPSSDIRRLVCVSDRCPDNHFLLDATWRHTYNRKTEDEFKLHALYVVGSFAGTMAILIMYIYTACTFHGFSRFLKENFPKA